MGPAVAPAPRAARLARASSLYLREASNQPIDWHPWGTEPFELARRTGRPILLDIGAAWCHWCHVMDEGTYVDPEVARLLGEHYVAVKVDRDEHPEVDRRFQRQVSAISGEGGWPLTAFLTPDGDVFYGGTYFPPSDGHGRPGFRRVLREVARLWAEEPGQVRDRTTTLRDALARMARAPPGAVDRSSRFATEVLGQVAQSFDLVHAGFGGAPKFPHPTAVDLLLWDDWRGGPGASGRQARETLVAMADGGLYDQLGGGFHRYSVDAAWHIPHFEKMGTDNAELLATYVDGFRRFGEPRFEAVVRGTVRWSSEVLGDPAGGWGASQDADNAPGDDGGYFTWSREELATVLDGTEAKLLSRVFGLGTEGRMPHDPRRNVLFRMLPVGDAAEGLALPAPPEDAFATACGRLAAARARRPTPAVDRALYASVNGRFLLAYTRAAATFDEPSWLAVAARAADRWLAHGLSSDRGIAHCLDGSTGRGFGLLEDQVAFARGLLELAVARPEAPYLAAAVGLLERVDRDYRGEDGLLRDVAPTLYDGPRVGGATDPAYPLEDTPHLSANAAAALAFGRLGGLLEDDAWRERARALVRAAARRLDGAGLFASGLALASSLLTSPSVRVVVEGEGPGAAALLRAARRPYHPSLAVFAGPPPPPFVGLAETGEAACVGAPRALVCEGTRCAPPVSEPAALEQRLRRSTAGSA